MSFNFRQIEDSEIIDLYASIESDIPTVKDVYDIYEELLKKGHTKRIDREELSQAMHENFDKHICKGLATSTITSLLNIVNKEAENALRTYMEK